MENGRDSQDKLVVKLSALQHFSYCPRQCALIYLEDIYQENLYTLQGNEIHERVHQEASRKRDDIRTETVLPVWSTQLGIRGQADLVEFHLAEPSKESKYRKIVPVEYKRGSKKEREADEVQLCAQSLCLEEMLDNTIGAAYIYHHSSHTRQEVELNKTLRQNTKKTIARVRKMLIHREVPGPVNDSRCNDCSLKNSCMPDCTGQMDNLRTYADTLYNRADG